MPALMKKLATMPITKMSALNEPIMVTTATSTSPEMNNAKNAMSTFAPCGDIGKTIKELPSSWIRATFPDNRKVNFIL